MPVYMGAPNVLEWAPPGSLIRTDDFASARELGHYLGDLPLTAEYLLTNETELMKYHAWRQEPFPRNFTSKWDHCLFTSGRERLCQWATVHTADRTLAAPLPSYKLDGINSWLTGSRPVDYFTFGLWLFPLAAGGLLEYAGVSCSLVSIGGTMFIEINLPGVVPVRGTLPIFPGQWTYARLAVSPGLVTSWVDFEADIHQNVFPFQLAQSSEVLIGRTAKGNFLHGLLGRVRLTADQPSFFDGNIYVAAFDEQHAHSIVAVQAEAVLAEMRPIRKLSPSVGS